MQSKNDSEAHILLSPKAEMNDREHIDDRLLDATNEYPELDATPSLIWVGKSKDHGHHDSTTALNGPLRHDLVKESSQNDHHFQVSDTKLGEDNEKNPWCQSSDDLDPDFCLSEECSMRVLSYTRFPACCS